MKKSKDINTIFVDCFKTILFRNCKTHDVFKFWSIKLSQIYNIDWKILYKTYNKTNFDLCFKKLFTSFTLEEQFDVVLTKTYEKLTKKYKIENKDKFVSQATELYFNTELEHFYINQEMIKLLKDEKAKGKKIYLVSDFYCKSDILKKWLESFNIHNIFDDIFSSSDFEKEKATTKIYKHLLKHLNLNPKNVIMYGDNLWSDVLMAKVCGLNAKRVKTQRRKHEKE